MVRPLWGFGLVGTLILVGLWWHDEHETAWLRHELRVDAVTRLAARQASVIEHLVQSEADAGANDATAWSRRLDAALIPSGVRAAVVDLRGTRMVVLADTMRGTAERSTLPNPGPGRDAIRAGDDLDGAQAGWSAIGRSGLHLLLVAPPEADLGIPEPTSHRVLWSVSVLVLALVGMATIIVMRSRQRRLESAVRDSVADFDQRVRTLVAGTWHHDAHEPLPAYLMSVVDTAFQALQTARSERSDQAPRPEQRIRDIASLLDSQTVPVFIKDRSGRYLYANAAFARLMHAEVRTIVGRLDEDIMPGIQARICRQTDVAVFSSGLPTVTEEFVAAGTEVAGGRWALIRKSVVELPGGLSLIVGMVTGLDEHRRVEQLARQGELHYHDLFDLGRDAVLIIEGADGTIIDANRQALALVRVTSGGLVGRTLPRLCADPTAATALCRSSTDSGVQTLAILTDDGATIDTETTVSWLDLPDGRKVAQVVLRDISDRQRALAEALAGQRAKTAFLATMSHELRTPLNGILGLADVLERGSLDGQQRELMGLLRASAMRLLDLLTNVLEYSRLDSGGSLGELSEFSPRVLVEDLIAGETVVAAAKQIGMETTIAAEVPAKVLGDPARLRLALHHLVSNAVKFTMAGHVSVSLRTVSRDGVRVRLAFIVTDTGIGIPPDRCNDLFKPFTQIDGSSTRCYEGSGLGLAIVERAITRMGGTVTVTSAIGIGSTFTIEMSFALPA